MVQKSALIKALLIGATCVAIIAYLRPSPSVSNAEREVEPPLVTKQTESIKPTAASSAVSDDKGGNWFVIENITGKCKPDEGPADMIKSLKTLGQPYEVKEDVVDGDKPMQVRLLLNDGVESGKIVYYRGKTLCQAQADKKKESTESELDRYK
ncbi:MAG: hypothetical protein HIU83_15185 [Proteobacteria bacterium]|nr:hypothetical protein [Pseudomonadota bacterium]